jgi:hypothetical protein
LVRGNDKEAYEAIEVSPAEEAKFDASALNRGQNEGMRIPSPSNEDDGIELPEPVKEEEEGYISEVNKDEIRGQEKATFDLSKIRGFDEKNGKDLSEPKEAAAVNVRETLRGFGVEKKPAGKQKKQMAEKRTAVSSGKEVNLQDIPEVSEEDFESQEIPDSEIEARDIPEQSVTSGHKVKLDQESRELANAYSAIQKAEQGYIAALVQLYPKKTKGRKPEEILAMDPKSVTWPLSENRKILTGLREVVDEAREDWKKIKGDPRYTDAQASQKKNLNYREDLDSGKPLDGIDPIAIDTKKVRVNRRRQLKDEVLADEAHKEIMDQQFPVEDDMLRTKLGSKVDSDNLDSGWFINEESPK